MSPYRDQGGPPVEAGEPVAKLYAEHYAPIQLDPRNITAIAD